MTALDAKAEIKAVIFLNKVNHKASRALACGLVAEATGLPAEELTSAKIQDYCRRALHALK